MQRMFYTILAILLPPPFCPTSRLDPTALQAWAEQTQWNGLEIVQHQPKIGKHHAQVEFKAYFVADGIEHVHHEHSAFVHINARWYFSRPHRTAPQYEKRVFFVAQQKI